MIMSSEKHITDSTSQVDTIS